MYEYHAKKVDDNAKPDLTKKDYKPNKNSNGKNDIKKEDKQNNDKKVQLDKKVLDPNKEIKLE